MIVDRDEYVLFYAPHTGIGVMRSADMMTWRDCGVMTLGVEAWDWAKGRNESILPMKNHRQDCQHLTG